MTEKPQWKEYRDSQNKSGEFAYHEGRHFGSEDRKEMISHHGSSRLLGAELSMTEEQL
jgi:hypothetical protein